MQRNRRATDATQTQNTRTRTTLTFCLKISFQILRENMEAADNTEESAELMTAAEMAPRPTKETKEGVRCWMTSGRIMAVWFLEIQNSASSHTRSVAFQSTLNRLRKEKCKSDEIGMEKEAGERKELMKKRLTNKSKGEECERLKHGIMCKMTL